MVVVAVLAGGRSPEHEVSVRSGAQVLEHLSGRWEAWPVWLDPDGMWWPSSGPAATGAPAEPGFRWPSMRPMTAGAAMRFLLEEAGIAVVFPVLHGPFGEDGTVQGMLELHGVPFVGSGCAASAVAMDKIRTRECLSYAGVAMPAAHVPRASLATAEADREATAIAASIGFPCFLKVDVSGSTLGVQRADERADVATFLREHRHMGRRFLAEQMVAGEEVTVPVLGNAGEELTALPAVGIYPCQDDYFTFEAKYDAALCDEEVPPRGLDEAGIAAVQALALRCHEALQCDGMSRTDIIVGPDGPVVLEVNTIPGLTRESLLPQAAAAAGIDFSALIDRLLELALGRSARVECWRTSP